MAKYKTPSRIQPQQGLKFTSEEMAKKIASVLNKSPADDLRLIDSNSADLRGRSVFNLMSTSHTVFHQLSNHVTIPVFPFYFKDDEYFWLSTSFFLGMKERSKAKEYYSIEGISIRVFTGDSSSSRKSLFRAEWDLPLNTKHAQPHWNIDTDTWLQSEQQTFEEYMAQGTAATILNEEITSELSMVGRFHFAMCAQWHHSDINHVDFQSIDNLVNWLNETIKYITSEVRSFYDRGS